MTLRYRRDVAMELQNDEYLMNSLRAAAVILVACTWTVV
jgi:hypothetical protein